MRRRQVGWRTLGGGLRVPIHADHEDVCAICEGSGHAPVGRVMSLLGRVHREFEALDSRLEIPDLGHPHAAACRAAMSDAIHVLRTCVTRHGSTLVQRLTEESQRRLMASPRSTLPGDDSAPSLDAETGPGVRDVVVAFVTSRSRAASRDESIAVGTERVRVRSSLDTAPLLLPDPPADQPPRGGRRQADRMVLIVARVGRSVMTPTGTVHELDAAIAVVLPAGGES